MVTYGLERDMLPLAELALHHDDVIAKLIERCVEAIYFGSPSFHPGHVSSRGMVHGCQILKCIPWYIPLSPSMEMDQPLQSIPYVAKFSRPKNYANRFQKGGAEIFATKIFAKAALIHCVIL